MSATGLGLFCLTVLSFSIYSTESVTGTFWHVTDIHYDESYSTEGYSCYGRGVPGSRPVFGDYKCDSPWSLVNNSIYAMKSLEPNPDFIMWTGDDTPHARNQSVLGTDKVLSIIGNLTDLIRKVFPTTPVYSALGNHDYHPEDQMPPHSNAIYETIGDMWKPWFQNSIVAENTFRNGGYYTLSVSDGLRAVVLNTVYYYTGNKLTANMSDPADQFAWLDQVLTNASRDGEKVYLIAHVPPGMFEKTEDTYWFYPKFNKIFNDMIIKNSHVMAGTFFGHSHTDSFKLYYKNDKPVAALLMAPSITPWENPSPVIGTPAHNPAIRLYYYNRTTPGKMDYVQYYTNLSQSFEGQTPQWEKEYRASEVYRIPDVTPQSLHDLTARFKAAGSVEFDNYFHFNGVNHSPDEKCDSRCKTTNLCSIQHVYYDQYNECMAIQTASTTRPPSSSGMKFAAGCGFVVAMMLALNIT